MMNLCFLHTGIAAMLWPMKKGRFPLMRGDCGLSFLSY